MSPSTPSWTAQLQLPKNPEVEKSLWSLADSVRGKSGGVNYFDLAVPMAGLLFLRWASSKEVKGETGDGSHTMRRQPLLSSRLRWDAWGDLRGARLSSFLREELLLELAGATGNEWARRLHRVTPALARLLEEADDTRDRFLDLVGCFDLSNVKGCDDASAWLTALLRAAGPKQGGEFTTPASVVDLMVELADPRPGERINDPCFGIGGLLVACAARMRKASATLPPEVWARIQQESFFGVEINPNAYVVGMTRLVLAGIENPGLELDDALERPTGEDPSAEGFDCVLAVPPWGTKAGRQRSSQFQVRASNVETLFLQQVMNSLRAGGRAVVALPEGVLFRSGAERTVRKNLLTDFRVEGVVSLPQGALAPFTNVKASLLVFRREPPVSSVRFYLLDRMEPPAKVGWGKATTLSSRVASELLKGTASAHLWEVQVDALRERDCELIAKRTGQDNLLERLAALEKQGGDIKIQPLGKIADVFAGVSYERSCTTNDPQAPGVVAGLLRVRDVSTAGPGAPSLFLTEEGCNHIVDDDALRLDDVVITLSGSIGKVGVVDSVVLGTKISGELPRKKAQKPWLTIVRVIPGTTDCVPTKGIAVIRPSHRIIAEYLNTLLRSECYQEWLTGRARGLTIQHLSIRTLRKLPVPVPSWSIQQAIAVASEKNEVRDPLDLLLASRTELTRLSVGAWLELAPEVQDVLDMRSAGASARIESLGPFFRSLQQLKAQEPITESDEFVDKIDFETLLVELCDVGRMVAGLSTVPEGMGKLALLYQSRLALERANGSLSTPENHLGHLDYEPYQGSPELSVGRALLVLHAMVEIVHAETERILDDLNFIPTLAPAWVSIGIPSQVQLTLTNESAAAVRNLHLRTVPLLGEGRFPYLPEKGCCTVALEIPPQSHTGPFEFVVSWSLDRLDGKQVTGDIPLSIEIRPDGPPPTAGGDLGASPYIVATPIDRKEMFFGREQLVAQLRRQLSTKHRANVILLEGARRSGKTSILKHLEADDILPGWVAAYCSLQGAIGDESRRGVPTKEVFKVMARDIANALHGAGAIVPLPGQRSIDPERPFRTQLAATLSQAFQADDPLEVFELYLGAALDAIRPRRLLLMLDEFDKIKEGIDSGVTSPQLPENIRYLLHKYSDLSAILTGARIRELREEHWSALFGLGYSIRVGALAPDEARKLVTQPVEGRLSYVPQAADRVVALCAGRPFIVQNLCNRIFEHAAQSGERTVTLSTVDMAASELATDNEHFRTLWGYAETERRRLILSLCERLESEPDPSTLGVLEAKLEECGVLIPKGERVGGDLEFLRDLDVLTLERKGGVSTYRITVPLMAEWIRRHIDFEYQKQLAVKEGEDESP